MGLRFTYPQGLRMCAQGWAKTYLDKMLNGLTGNLDRLFYPFNTNCWLQKSFQDGGMEGWWPYEQAAYWLDGYVKCAYFAGNEGHFAKAKKLIDDALSVVDEKGFVGATELKKQGEGNQWVHAVFFRAVLFLYDITGDKGYLTAVKNHYLSGFNDYSKWRETVNVENMLVCYFHDGDERLKDLAVQAYKAHSADKSNIETKASDFLSDNPIEMHGVTYNEMLKIPMLLYAATGDESYLQIANAGLNRLRKHHLLPLGIHSASEYFGGTFAHSCVETCDISDHTWTLGYFASVTGKSEYLDCIERIMYNLAPAVMDEQFKSLQYYSSMNHPIATRVSNHSGSFTQTPRTTYQSNHYPECCTGNANRSMPNFLYRSLQQTEKGYAFWFYIPCEYCLLGGGKFVVETQYPYKEKVRIIYKGAPRKMELSLRVPAWCKNFAYACDKNATQKEGWLVVDGEFIDGDSVEVTLASALATVETDEGFIIQKQPLLYTLKIGAKWEVDKEEPRQTAEYPAYNLTPTTAWQIALDKELFERTAVLSGSKTDDLLCTDYKVQAQGYLMEGVDFCRTDTTKIFISEYDKGEIVKLRRMGQIIYDGELVFPPKIRDIRPSGLTKTQITLIPYGASALRWTVFPDAKKL